MMLVGIRIGQRSSKEWAGALRIFPPVGDRDVPCALVPLYAAQV
jgi:hypothetical protein